MAASTLAPSRIEHAAPPAGPVAVAAPSQPGSAVATAPAASGLGRSLADTPLTASDAQDAVLAKAQSLLLGGDVIASRRLLEGELPGQRHTVALQIGRTYDPHYLGQIAGANAGADPGRARHYYELAAKLGSGAATLDLHRLDSNRPQN